MRNTLILLAFVLVGCGGGSDSLTAPTPPPAAAPAFSLSGTWSGTYAQQLDGQPDAFRVLGTLTQEGTRLSGSLANSGNTYLMEFTGTMTTPTADAQVTGTLRINARAAVGTSRCIGEGTFTGTVSPLVALRVNTLVIENCAGIITDIAIDLTRES